VDQIEAQADAEQELDAGDKALEREFKQLEGRDTSGQAAGRPEAEDGAGRGQVRGEHESGAVAGLTEVVHASTPDPDLRFVDLRALFLNWTLKRWPEFCRTRGS